MMMDGYTADLIRRQAAIDAFMTSTSDGDKAMWCEWVLKQLPPAQQWIPCKEKLPEEAGWYLITYEAPIGSLVGLGYFFRAMRRFDPGMTSAWMPLPEPYKVAEKGEKE